MENQHRFWSRHDHCLAVYLSGKHLASLELGILAHEGGIRNFSNFNDYLMSRAIEILLKLQSIFPLI